jgi:hypothetical protein
MESQQAIINELIERVRRLEAAPRRRAYNQQQAAAQLNMSVSKFREERKAHRVRGVLNGRIWTFTEEALAEYLAAQSVSGDPA